MKTIGIHGFGRIGRTTLRIALSKEIFVPVSISDIQNISTLAALFEVDSCYGRWPYDVGFEMDTADWPCFMIGKGQPDYGIEVVYYVDSSKELPDWKKLGVDVVIDCTGRATARENAQKHIDRGAKKVLVSAPPKTPQDCDAILLQGINLESYDPLKHHIISMASCTTNALAPVVKILEKNFGIVSGFFSTVHAYTSSQSLTDQPMKDRRDSWAAAENIIPSTSGAAKALKFIWPNLNITGKAYRVPVKTGSIVELDVLLRSNTNIDQVKNVFRDAAKDKFLHVLGVLEEEYASSRIVGESHSSIVDLPLIQILDGNHVSIPIWYDNEHSYASRLADVARYIAIQF